MDIQTASEVGKVITTINWEGVILIISLTITALIPVYKWIWGQTKQKKEGEGPLTKSELFNVLTATKSFCRFDGDLVEELKDRLVETKDMLRDIASQMKTEKIDNNRVEENLERVRKNLADLLEFLRNRENSK